MLDIFGRRCGDSFAYYDRDSCSLKTCQGTLFSDLTESSVTLPKTGTMQNGVLFPLRTLEPPISGNGCSSWPTPRASPNEDRQTKRTPSQEAGTHGLSLAAEVNEPATNWPTAGAHDYKGSSRIGQLRGQLDEATEQKYAWTTPCAGDTSHRTTRYKQGGTATSMQAGGRLNPRWVETLMGFPVGWTLTDGPPLRENHNTSGNPQELSKTKSLTESPN